MGKENVRPRIAEEAYISLSILALLTALGLCPMMPEWFLPAYIGGSMIDVLGWQIVRQKEKASNGKTV